MRRSRLRNAAASLVSAVALAGTLALATAVPAQAQSRTARSINDRASRVPTIAPADSSRAYWVDIKGAAPTVSARGATAAVRPARFRSTTLDRNGLAALAATAPAEFSAAARQNPLVISLPGPTGDFQRFRIVDSPVMEPGLAARHPDIHTYAGRGVDDPTATLRMDISPLGLHASVFSTKGAWYIDPYYHLDDSLYVSYWRRDLSNARAPFSEGLIPEAQVSLSRGRYHAADTVRVDAIGFAPGAQVMVTVRNSAAGAAPRQPLQATASGEGIVSLSLPADPYRNLGSFEVTASDGRISATSSYRVVADKVALDTAVGDQLRTYRLALLTDPGYANFFGGPANVTAAKVTLINRVSQVYETETSIRLVLINGNDALNLDSAAQMTGSNGPCGGAACYSASQAGSCTSSTLSRTRVVIGLLAGAGNFDIGHIAIGANGGGVASLGVVGRSSKAQGCTGIPQPVGDAFAVDYVAHEMGHQFAGNHTFNGTISNCSGGNRNSGTSVEPGSGSSVMAYAGICGSDNLQAHSDPYWSQRSFDEITAYTSGAENNLSDVQVGVLSNFNTNGQQFQLRYAGNDSAPIVRGSNFTTAGVKAAVEAITGWPVGATVSVSQLSDNAFTITFGGTLSGVDAESLSLLACTGGCSGYVGEITAGGPTTRGGTVNPTGNSAPVVSVAASYTIPLRTPFALTGSASDVDNTPTTYLWEQNDRGASSGTGLVTNDKTAGPLFRQFGTRALVNNADSQRYNSPGENSATTDPTRVFPDMAQILANNTNAETGVCPTVAGSPTTEQTDCYSEYLPTASYVGVAGVNASPASLNFKLTARDGAGGVNSATTTLVLAPNAGPFRVTSPNTAVSLDSGSTQAVSWDVAGTNVAPVSTATVKISLSVDGGSTFPFTLAASAPNTGSRSVTLPSLGTTRGRIKVEAVGNVYFDVSNADFTIRLLGDVDGDGAVTCLDVRQVRNALGSAIGQPGFDPRNDVNNDGVVNVRDLAFVSQRLAAGTRCQ